MKKQEKWTKVVALAAVVAAGTTFASATPAHAGQAAKVTLKLGMWASSPAETALVKKQVAAFEKQNPNYQVTIVTMNGNYMQTLQAGLAAKTSPDVFYVDSSVAPTLETANVLMPLGSYIKQDKVNLSAYSSTLIKAFQWKGTQYGIPKDMNTLALEYNKTLLSKAGIATPPKTWTEFEQDAAKLRTAGIVPMSIDIDPARYYPMVLDFGGSFFDASTDKATFTNPKNIAGLNFYLQNAALKNFVRPKDQGASWAGDAFAQGKVAFALEGAWIVPAVQSEAPKLDWGISNYPTANGKDYNYAFTVSYSMAKATKNPTAAAKLLFFMTGSQALKMTADSGLALPSLAAGQSEFLKKYPNYQAFVNGVKDAVPFQFGTLGQNFLDAITSATQAGVLKNETASDVLKQAQQTLNQQSNY